MSSVFRNFVWPTFLCFNDARKRFVRLAWARWVLVILPYLYIFNMWIFIKILIIHPKKSIDFIYVSLCRKFPIVASGKSLGRISVPMWLIILLDQLLIIMLATSTTNKLDMSPSFCSSTEGVLETISNCCPPPKGMFLCITHPSATGNPTYCTHRHPTTIAPSKNILQTSSEVVTCHQRVFVYCTWK